MSYTFGVERFATREEDGSISLPPLTFPSQLGHRYLQVGVRQTPVYLANDDAAVTEVEVELPKGSRVQNLAAKTVVKSEWGVLERTESQSGGVFKLTESIELKKARVAPKNYGTFGEFAGDFDLVQSKRMRVSAR